MNSNDQTTNKPTIVFFHAFPLNSEMWKDQIAALSATHRCLAVDLPGYSGSPLPTHAVTFEHYVDHVISYLEKAGVKKSIFCGLSMGGYLALRLFDRAPELCSALILCDTKAGADGNEAKLKRAAGVKSLIADREAYATGQFKALIGESNLPNESIKARFESIVSKNHTDGIAAGLVAMATRNDSTETLSKIKVPTLIIVGKEDQVTPLTEAELLNQGISGSKLVVIEKAGHLSNLENPAAFNEAVSKFIAVL